MCLIYLSVHYARYSVYAWSHHIFGWAMLYYGLKLLLCDLSVVMASLHIVLAIKVLKGHKSRHGGSATGIFMFSRSEHCLVI